MLQSLAGFAIGMSQIGTVIVSAIKKKFLCKTPREFAAAEAPPALFYGYASKK